MTPTASWSLTQFTIKMKPPLEKESVEVKAEMVRITYEGIGVKFIDLTPHEDEIIRGWINFYRNTVPLLEKAKCSVFLNTVSALICYLRRSGIRHRAKSGLSRVKAVRFVGEIKHNYDY